MLSGPPASTVVTSDQLLDRFLDGNGRQRRSLLSQIQIRRSEWGPLMLERLEALNPWGDDWAVGNLLQTIAEQDDSLSEALWQRHPKGWLNTDSSVGIDYSPLQEFLLRRQFEAADRFTSETLRQLGGPEAVRRGYVYFSEVPAIDGADLVSLDRLWVSYSQGRFGFSVQARLLRSLGGRWEKLWPRLGWKQDGTWTRYPGSFNWSLEAPEGHMPLINQLRGVRMMDALLQHPALVQRSEG